MEVPAVSGGTSLLLSRPCGVLLPDRALNPSGLNSLPYARAGYREVYLSELSREGTGIASSGAVPGERSEDRTQGVLPRSVAGRTPAGPGQPLAFPVSGTTVPKRGGKELRWPINSNLRANRFL